MADRIGMQAVTGEHDAPGQGLGKQGKGQEEITMNKCKWCELGGIVLWLAVALLIWWLGGQP